MNRLSRLRYVYAVCRPFGAPLQAEVSGVADTPPKLLDHRDLVAVLGAVPEQDFAEPGLSAHLADADWLARTVAAHRRVVAALTTVTSPLPLRPMTVFRDDSGVRTMMETRNVQFRRTLQRLDGRVEWTVEMHRAEMHRAEMHRAGTHSEGVRDAGGVGDPARRLHERLGRFADEARWCPPKGPGQRAAGRSAPAGSARASAPAPVLYAAYLVDRARSEEFVEAVDEAKGTVPGLRVELSGPWAAYSFTGMHPEPTGPWPGTGPGTERGTETGAEPRERGRP